MLTLDFLDFSSFSLRFPWLPPELKRIFQTLGEICTFLVILPHRRKQLGTKQKRLGGTHTHTQKQQKEEVFRKCSNPMNGLRKKHIKKQISSFLTRFWDSRPCQLSTHTVFDEASDVQFKNKQILESQNGTIRKNEIE